MALAIDTNRFVGVCGPRARRMGFYREGWLFVKCPEGANNVMLITEVSLDIPRT